MHSVQNNKYATFLQHLQKELSDEVDFLPVDKKASVFHHHGK